MQRERKVRILRVKIRIRQIRRFSFTLNSSFMSKSVNCPRKSRHIGMKQNGADYTIRNELFLAQMFNEEDERNLFFFTTGRNNGKIVSGWYSLLKLYRKEKK